MITRIQAACIAILMLGDFTFAAIYTSRLPASVPVHWNFRGEVDRYGSPWELAIASPLLLAITVGVMMIVPLIGSTRESLGRSGAMYGRMILAAVAMLVAMHVMLLLRWDHPSQFIVGLLVDVGVLIVVMGNWTGKIRRNPVMGIRTPWTLKSEFVWERTNRAVARWMMAQGAAVILAAILLPAWMAIVVLLGGLIALVVWAMLYSRIGPL